MSNGWNQVGEAFAALMEQQKRPDFYSQAIYPLLVWAQRGTAECYALAREAYDLGKWEKATQLQARAAYYAAYLEYCKKC
jgi:hypothetical protein